MRVLRIGTLGAVGLAACAAAVAVGQSGPDKAADIKASIDISKPKNIILFIGDGMGEQEVTDYAKEKGYKYVATKDELNAVTSLGAGERLLGLFHDTNMTTEFNALIASDTGAGSPTTKCTPSNRGTEPSLKEMTQKAIALLQGNQKGFVLQVEGASIDKRDHSADACGQIGELLGMDDAVGVAQEFQRTHPDTLILVTADHSHTSQIIPVTQTPRGAYTTLQTVDGAPIRIAYGTAPVSGSQAHTGSTVPVFASGPRAADIVGTIDQTELFPILTNTQTSPNNGSAPVIVSSDVGGNVPATLSLTTGPGAATFAPFVPGAEKDYTASLVANVISSAANATLSVADTSSIATGRLVNGSFSLSRPLEAKSGSGTYAPVGGSAAPTTLATWGAPVANAATPIDFRQSIGATEPLRTGPYTKTLTLTLSTTAP